MVEAGGHPSVNVNEVLAGLRTQHVLVQGQQGVGQGDVGLADPFAHQIGSLQQVVVQGTQDFQNGFLAWKKRKFVDKLFCNHLYCYHLVHAIKLTETEGDF